MLNRTTSTRGGLHHFFIVRHASLRKHCRDLHRFRSTLPDTATSAASASKIHRISRNSATTLPSSSLSVLSMSPSLSSSLLLLHDVNQRRCSSNETEPNMPNPEDMLTSEDMEFYDPLTDDFFPTSSNTGDDTEYGSGGSSTIEDEEYEEKEMARRKAISDELDSRKGRLWEDYYEITDEDWSSGKSFYDLPDWTEKICSRISKERVKIHPDGVPTLDGLAKLKLPKPAVHHPALGNPKPYLKHRKDQIYKRIYDAVVAIAEPKMEKILSLENWDDKQDAIDDLFEQIHDEIKYKEMNSGGNGDSNSEDDHEYMTTVLGSQPNFPKLVERALENYLKVVSKNEKAQSDGTPSPNAKAENSIEPIFLDIMKVEGSTLDENGVPKLIHPIKPHRKDGPGRMLEEWELSAKEDTKRILCRQCISEIAQYVVQTQGKDTEAGSRVYVTGRQGAGKTAALIATVASARLSGHIVLYIPDGNRLSELGYYVEPNALNKTGKSKMFDLPILTNEVCTELLESHEKDLEGFSVTSETLNKYISSDQLKKLGKEIGDQDEDGDYSLVDLLKVGSKNIALGPGCYGAVINTLMNQTEKPFTVVMDEFNCYFEPGHYFHGEYDPEVKNSIPLNKITLFQPFLDAVGVERKDDGTIYNKEAVPMKRGSIVVGTSENHAVKRNVTSALHDAIEKGGCNIVDVPQYSSTEVEHVLANFEIIGIGRLRFDRGATVMNSQEVKYLRMVSGGVGQRLLDACIH